MVCGASAHARMPFFIMAEGIGSHDHGSTDLAEYCRRLPKVVREKVCTMKLIKGLRVVCINWHRVETARAAIGTVTEVCRLVDGL